jgi:hypothetical protein
MTIRGLLMLAFLVVPTLAHADTGDPQIRTDHPWYPGELACSTFARLFETQEQVYRRVTGKAVATDEDRALAAWLWRNTHYYHGEEGAQDYWGAGFGKGGDSWTRDYWTGMFSHGFGLCGTTHSQWVAELEARLGHGRARTVGTQGHNSFEAFLTGGPYGSGRWAMIDHDLSTVVFDPDGKRLLGIGELVKDSKRLASRGYRPERQHGWLICGLHAGDAGSYARYAVAEYLAGYAGPPPMVHLRRGESLRRYFKPGLDDGKTFVFWGRNYNTGGIPGPERSLTWVNQPEAMYRSKTGTPYRAGQARYANAVFTYRPDFRSGDYKEGVVSESNEQVTFAFQSPYVIAATPANDRPWGIYDAGCKNGLVVRGKASCAVSVSVDRGATWHDAGRLDDRLDLTDRVKGFRQYWLRLHTLPEKLAGSGLTITTVCQANESNLPRLADGDSTVILASSGRALVSAGPTRPQAQAHVVDGRFDSPAVTLALATPHGEPIRVIHAAAHVASSSPPDPKVLYQVEYSLDGGKSWQPIVKDWFVRRQGDEPPDFWSQSHCWGSKELAAATASKALVRFRNNGGKRYLRAEVHLEYEVSRRDDVQVTFAWTDVGGPRTHRHLANGSKPMTWQVPTGKAVNMTWVEMQPVTGGR